MNKFSAVSVDADTVILSEKQINLDGLDALLQEWRWDGIKANSLIVLVEDVSDLNIKSILVNSGLDGASGTSTISRSRGYVFLNYNFRY